MQWLTCAFRLSFIIFFLPVLLLMAKTGVLAFLNGMGCQSEFYPERSDGKNIVVFSDYNQSP